MVAVTKPKLDWLAYSASSYALSIINIFIAKNHSTQKYFKR